MKLKQRLVFTVLMSFILSAVMTGWVTFINLGLTNGFGGQWIRAFVIAWPAAGLISFIFTPWLQDLSYRLTLK